MALILLDIYMGTRGTADIAKRWKCRSPSIHVTDQSFDHVPGMHLESCQLSVISHGNFSYSSYVMCCETGTEL